MGRGLHLRLDVGSLRLRSLRERVCQDRTGQDPPGRL